MSKQILPRFCIDCREIFGCVVGEETKECMTCKEVNRCGLRFDLPDPKVVTGGICAACFFLIQAKRAAKRASIPLQIAVGEC